MPNHNAKFVSAVFAGVLAGANFIPVLNNSANAEDSCLTAPNGQTPHGSHWYYRIEHGTKRHCWYLRGENDAHSQSAAAESSSPPAPAQPAPKAEAAVQGSVANARAELPWPQTRTAPETPALTPAPAPAPAAAIPAPTGQVPAAAAADTPNSDNTLPSTATAGGAAPSQASATSRWPDQLNTGASVDSAPAADDSNTNAQPDTAAAPQPSPAAAAVPPATTDVPPSGAKQPGSMQALLTIMVAALALAGLVAGAILRFGRRKGDEDETEFDLDRRPVWDREHSEPRLAYPTAAAPRPNIGRPRELRGVEPDDTIKEMLARLARSAQT